MSSLSTFLTDPVFSFRPTQTWSGFIERDLERERRRNQKSDIDGSFGFRGLQCTFL